MGVHIWHFMVLALYISNGFGAYAVTSSDFGYDDDHYVIDDFENITVLVNTSLVLQCPKNTSELSWRFLLNHEDLTGEILTNNSVVYNFLSKSHLDSGFYACFIHDKLIKKFNITVFEAPSFFKKNAQKLVVKPAGNMVKLNCRASGFPTPNITWYKEDKSPPTRKLGDIKINHWSLTLEDLVPTDKGNYTCAVCNIVGCINNTFLVDVVERYHNTPILTNGLGNMTVTFGENVSLSCQFVSDLHPFVVWTKLPYTHYNCSYEDPKDCNAIRLQTSDDGKINPEVYEIFNVTHEDEGWYACFASNSLGTTVSRAYLQVVDEEPLNDLAL